MAFTVWCAGCKRELEKPGGLLFSSPEANGIVMKDHLCERCYNRVTALLWELGIEGAP